MELLILGTAIILLSFLLSLGLLIAFINFGVLPRPEKSEFARYLYWRADGAAEQLWQVTTYGLSSITHLIYNPAAQFSAVVIAHQRKSYSPPVGADHPLLIIPECNKSNLDVIPISVHRLPSTHERLQ
jgi:hypothetical protein